MLALLVIDQQKGIDSALLGPRNNPLAQQQILMLLAKWRELKWPIFHIRHRSTDPASVFWPLQQGFQFKEEFTPQLTEQVIEKSVPCAFIHNTLDDQLKQLSVEGVVISGAATNNSVESTARTAGNLQYQTYVVEDACFTFDKADYFGTVHTAAQVHAMSLGNLHEEYATVINYEELMRIFAISTD